MPSPLAFLAGFGQGAAGLGTDMETQAALQEAQRARRATDALTRLATMVKLGAQPVMPGTDPTQALQALQNRNTQQAGLVNAPGAGAFSGGMDPSQFGQPQIANLPTAAGGQDSFILDPSRTPEALAELRAGRAEDARYRQATDVERQRTEAAKAEKDQERKTADTRSASEAVGFAQSLNAMTNGKHPLLKMLPGPLDTEHWVALAPSLKQAVADEASTKHDERVAAAAQSGNTYLTGLDPNTGMPTVFAGTTKGPPSLTNLGVGKPVGGGGMGGAVAPVDDMVQRYDEIKQHASDLAAGKWRITPAMQTREALTYATANASAGGHPNIKTQLGGVAMDFVGVGQGDKPGDFDKYQALMNSTRAMGDDATKVFKGRQNEDAVKREIALAQLTPDDYKNQTVVAQKLQRLQNVINLARAIEPKVLQSPPTGGTGTPNSDLDAYIANRGGKKKP